ncbi:bifunctional RNase H/acid phosphatase [Nocardioides sp. SOB44]|uniref:Bifunctional RNase H/acid phosphatase n=1 Tax=Nocardioides cremeus TaxID=3058044 RepID=A0ABT8TR58_9ACTN|nr:bifunctional RNase H/acid phosphatase [Nocardioides cremeus]MDO3394981.1 bifunctional RNase H/acid phosphatase [Nocardioides cremeus]
MTSRVVVEADGGSRGNPGPAAYGAVLKDAASDQVIAEDARTIGVASNNVAEYSGLVAGLRLAVEHAPGAEVEVRMDSKLVVEQMSGRWKIKHPDMRVLAAEAGEVAPPGTTYTWIPRARNAHADRLANEALDGVREGVVVAEAEPALPADAPGEEAPDEESLIEEIESPGATRGEQPRDQAGHRGWSGPTAPPTTLVLVRHGVTRHTAAKRFSGGLGGDDPALSEEGLAQARDTADWLTGLGERVDAVVSSPVRRTRETAEVVAARLERTVEVEPGFAEMEFGEWDGLTFAEVAERDKAGLDAWLGSMDVAPPGGESFGTVRERVLAGLDRVLAEHAGRTVVVVSHVTPIKTLVAHALGAPLEAVYRMELSPASVTVLSFYADPAADGAARGSMRLYNALPPGERATVEPGRW